MAWNRTSEAPKVAPKKVPSKVRGIVAGLVVVCALGGLCLWMFSGGDAAPKAKPDKERGRIKEVAPAKVPKRQTDAPSTQTVPVKPTKAAVPQEVVKSVETNASGFIVENVIQANGRPLIRVKEPPSVWECETDRIIASAVMCNEWQEIPPFPPMDKGDEVAFRESLSKPIKVLETDTEEVRALKFLVSEAREVIKERIDGGETFVEILEDHRKLFNENTQIRAKAVNELLEIKRSGDAEGARKYEITINAAFSQMGIDPIDGSDDDQTQGDSADK